MAIHNSIYIVHRVIDTDWADLIQTSYIPLIFIIIYTPDFPE